MTRSEKIKILLSEGYPPKQAIAMAYQMVPKKKNGPGKRVSTDRRMSPHGKHSKDAKGERL